jgi:hypothetical protein
MIATSFSMRVTRDTCLAAALLALPAAWIAGSAGGLGILAGALLAVGNFLWLARRASAAGQGTVGTPSAAMWALTSGLRLLALGFLCAVLFKFRLIHPVALVAGLTVLPCAVIVQGLRAAGKDA